MAGHLRDKIHYAACPSPIGTIWVASDLEGVCLLRIRVSEDAFVRELAARGLPHAERNEASSRFAIEEIQRYFAGELMSFRTPIHPHGTPFASQVWGAVREIPFGTTRSYEEVARVIGRPLAFRGVGGALGGNPIPLLIPCHRVIRKDGSLGGFSSGVAIKEWLLSFEARVRDRLFSDRKI